MLISNEYIENYFIASKIDFLRISGFPVNGNVRAFFKIFTNMSIRVRRNYKG
jgi:hypothetical protein